MSENPRTKIQSHFNSNIRLKIKRVKKKEKKLLFEFNASTILQLR